MRLIANKLNIKLRDATEFTCCPDPQGLKSYNEELWILTAARNLALAEQSGLDILTICNGCYSTFRKVSALLSENPALKNKINSDLEKLNLNFRGSIKTKHLNEIIIRDVTLKKLDLEVTNYLTGLKVATHYGCHLIRPANIVEFNDHQKPNTIENILETIGAKNVKDEGKDLCCGGGLNFTDEMNSFKFIQKKILNIQAAKADCIVVTCPYCFLQFEIGQLRLQKNNFLVNIPILHLSEILAMALGIPEIEDLLNKHKIKPSLKLTQLIESNIDRRIQLAKEEFNYILLKKCSKCRACSQDCSLVSAVDFDPLIFVDLVLEGRIEEAIKNEGIWYCLNCYSCLEKCPQRMGLAHFFIKLRNLATKYGYAPKSITAESKKFLKEGTTTGKITGLRKKLKLPLEIMNGIEDLNQVIKDKEDMDVET